LTWHTALTTWTTAAIADVLAALLLAGYLGAVLRLRRAGVRWPAGRIACWLGGVAVLLVAVHSSIAVYGHALLWVHMIWHLMLIMVVPVLLIWGQPIRLVRKLAGHDDLPTGTIGARLLRWVTFPLFALAIYTAVLVGTHLTGFPETAATQMWGHQLELGLYLVSGFLLFLPLAGTELTPWPVPHFVRFALLGLAMGADTLVGVALMLTGQPLAPGTALLRPGWGPSLLADQSASGAIMWVVGDSLMMLLMLAVAAQWSASGSQARLGDWLESARRQSLAGIGSRTGEDRATLDRSIDVDDDDEALQAYNRMLGELNRRSTRE
jgi:putative membrane protein